MDYDIVAQEMKNSLAKEILTVLGLAIYEENGKTFWRTNEGENVDFEDKDKINKILQLYKQR